MTDYLTFWLGEDAAAVWAAHLAKIEQDAAEQRNLQEGVDE